MRRIFLFLTVILLSLKGMSQTVNNLSIEANYNQNEKIIDLLSRIDTLMAINNELLSINMALKNRYKLYQTENIYTLLELDTKTGQIQQIQWSLDPDNEGTMVINDDDLSWGYGSGVFELYPTQNMYQFILLDKTNGRKWHVQWGMSQSNRWIRRIY